MILGFSFPFSLYHLTYINNINNISPLCFEFIFCHFSCELEKFIATYNSHVYKKCSSARDCYA